MMRHWKLILLSACLLFQTLPGFCQSNALIKKLESQRSELARQLKESESLLTKTKNSVANKMGQLNTLNAQVKQQQAYIESLNQDVGKIDAEMGALTRQLQTLESELNQRKRDYANSVRYLYKNRSIQEKLMFILSADNLSQTYRRLRYVREYATWQRLQGDEILKKQDQVKTKQDELSQVRASKQDVLKERQEQSLQLQSRQKEQQKLLQDLQKQQKSLQSEVSKKKKQASQLDSQIDKLIAEEIKKSQKASSSSKSTTSSKTSSKKTSTSDGYILSADEQKLSGSFASNKGNLPIPVTGPYMIVNKFGQYRVEGLKNVVLDSKGIDIQGKDGAKARAVFDGKVVSVFQLNGQMNILIRHGAYISVYCNLSSVSVKNGQEVKARQELGAITQDASTGRTVLHFQLRKEKDKLNPEPWLKK